MAIIKDFLEMIDLQGLLNHALQVVVDYLPSLLEALAVLVGFWVGWLIAKRVMKVYLGRTKLPDSVREQFIRVARYLTLIGAVITAASQVVDVLPVVGGLSVAGLAVSFAAKDTIANVICGITLLIDQPFVVGDWVEIGGTHALVTGIQLRTTTLSTFENQTIVIPNRVIAEERIINYTIRPRIRVRVPIGISYREDIRAARTAMLDTVAGDSDVMEEPKPEVVVAGLGASSVELELRFWIENSSLQWRKQWDYLEKCKYALDEAGIEIPFPHLQMFLERSEGLAELADAVGRA
ncbi:MAG: mechanosensitive ion channel family protein [Planctomycetota bacterium]|jgi:small-conductance mechanosensitive channel